MRTTPCAICCGAYVVKPRDFGVVILKRKCGNTMKLILIAVVFGALGLATPYLPNMSMGYPLTFAALDSKGFFDNVDRFGL
jgi:hypothetical protein